MLCYTSSYQRYQYASQTKILHFKEVLRFVGVLVIQVLFLGFISRNITINNNKALTNSTHLTTCLWYQNHFSFFTQI